MTFLNTMYLCLIKLSQKVSSFLSAYSTLQRNFGKFQKVKYFMLTKESALGEVTKGSDSCAR